MPPSAVDVVSPAIETAKRQALKPFQWARWWRMGILGLATGEATGGGCNFNGNIGRLGEIFNKQQPHSDQFLAAASPGVPEWFWTIIPVLIIGGLVLIVVHLYIASTLRFVLFDAVAAERYRLRAGWSRWEPTGRRYFLFQLGFGIVMLAVLGALLGPFIFAAIKAGTGAAWIPLLAMVPIVLLIALLAALFSVFVKDFAVPVMALEQVGVIAALRRVFALIRAEKGGFAAYIGMKIVLAIVTGILLAIVNFILLIVPVIVIVVIAIAIGVGKPDIFTQPATIATIAVFGMLAVAVLLFVMGTVATPITIFFQAYTLIFFAGRYRPLWDLLYPAPPPPPQSLELPPDVAPAT